MNNLNRRFASSMFSLRLGIALLIGLPCTELPGGEPVMAFPVDAILHAAAPQGPSAKRAKAIGPGGSRWESLQIEISQQGSGLLLKPVIGIVQTITKLHTVVIDGKSVRRTKKVNRYRETCLPSDTRLVLRWSEHASIDLKADGTDSRIRVDVGAFAHRSLLKGETTVVIGVMVIPPGAVSMTWNSVVVELDSSVLLKLAMSHLESAKSSVRQAGWQALLASIPKDKPDLLQQLAGYTRRVSSGKPAFPPAARGGSLVKKSAAGGVSSGERKLTRGESRDVRQQSGRDLTNQGKEGSSAIVTRQIPSPPSSIDPLGREWIAKSAGIKLVRIEAGRFLMGSSKTEKGHGTYESPVHEVRISRPFLMGSYEVTQSQYKTLTGADPSHFKGEQFPVERVSWGEAMTFCKELTKREERLGQVPKGYVYRLPTEAEWEYACRSGTTTVFGFGNSLTSQKANFNGQAPYGNNDDHVLLDLKRSTTVGSYPPSAWGLHDMHGNVSEWCLDEYQSFAYLDLPAKDPLAIGKGTARSHRGGVWRLAGMHCRSARRNADESHRRLNTVGFRVVLAPYRDVSQLIEVADRTATVEPVVVEVTAAASNTKLPKISSIDETGWEWVAGSCGLELVAVAPGEFMMGSPKSKWLDYLPKSWPPHQVRISRRFLMGRYEVTQSQYLKVTGKTPSEYRGNNLPVDTVSWNDAMAFCKELTRLEGALGRLPSGYVYRLPTEAEWEYCSRAGTSTTFAHGNSLSSRQANFNGATPDGKGQESVYLKRPTIVGSYKPNPWGLYDMLGNVGEYCLDAFDLAAYEKHELTDPYIKRGERRIKPGTRRVTRGGIWNYSGPQCRPTNRISAEPDSPHQTVGFRVVLAPIL